LLVERVKELLSGGCSGERGAAVERAAETTLIAKAFVRAVEGYAQAVHEIDDLWRPIGKFFHRRLVLEEVAAIDGVVEMLPLVVAELLREVVHAVDAALRASTVRAFDGQ
jgi:hypothetical protein